jgi:hypothetical protein
MEFDPFNSFSPEGKPDKEKKEEKRTKKRDKFAAPIPVEKTAEPAERTPFEKAVANLAFKKQTEKQAAEAGEPLAVAEQASSAKKAAKKPELSSQSVETEEQRAGNAPQETVEAVQSTAEVAQDEADESEKNETKQQTDEGVYETIPLHPNQLNVGELVINLHGDRPVAERVLPLDPAETPLPPTGSAAAEQPMWRSQPQQQQQQRVSVAAAEGREVFGAAPLGSGAELPPTQPREGLFAVPDLQPETPEPLQSYTVGNPYQQMEQGPVLQNMLGNQPSAAKVENVDKNVVTRQEMEDEIYYATKYGQRRGVLAGAVVAGAYEHFKHRRREKRAEKHQEHLAKQHNKQLRKYEVENAHLTTEKQTQAAKLQEFERAQAAAPYAAERPVYTEQRQFTASEQNTTPRFESRSGTSAETKTALKPEQLSSKPEQPAVVPADAPEQLAIPKDHRIETSAWHSIEVDARTGKAVENPTFAYGHEYYHERAQEAGPRDTQRTAAAGEVALVAAAMDENGRPTGGGSADSGMPPPYQLPPDASQRTRSGGVGFKPLPGAKPTDTQSSGPLWPWLVALGVVIVLLFVVL